MHLERMVMPDGSVSWTAFDGDKIVEEVRDFVLFLEARHYASSTLDHYVRHVVRLGNYLGAFGKTFWDITAKDLDRFIPAVVKYGAKLDQATSMNIIPLRQEYVEITTSLYNQILYSIKAFYSFLELERTSALFDQREIKGEALGSYKKFLEHINERRGRRAKEARADKNAKATAAKRAADSRLKPDEVLRIIEAAANMRDAFLVVLLYVTGMRIGEARGLLHEDFRIESNDIWVTPRKLENGARVKNGKARCIPVNDFIMRMYEDYIASDEYLPAFEAGTDFVLCNIHKGRIGRGLTHANVYEIQDALIRRSGVQFTWHVFRHTHASEAIAQGHSLLDVADRLGHASPQTTNGIYKHLFNAEYRKMKLKTHDQIESGLDNMRRRALTEDEIKWL